MKYIVKPWNLEIEIYTVEITDVVVGEDGDANSAWLEASMMGKFRTLDDMYGIHAYFATITVGSYRCAEEWDGSWCKDHEGAAMLAAAASMGEWDGRAGGNMFQSLMPMESKELGALIGQAIRAEDHENLEAGEV